MASYTITTTDDQEAALVHAFQHQASMPPVGPQPKTAPLTQEEFLQTEVNMRVLDPMLYTLARDINNALIASLATIPPENRDEAFLQNTHIIGLNGGTVVEKGARQWPERIPDCEAWVCDVCGHKRPGTA